MAHETIRSFLAVTLSEAIKKEAYLFVKTIQDQCSGFRFVDSQNWHLTLHFLGQVETEKIEELKTRLPKALTNIKPFLISLEGFGAFPNERKPRILWMGIKSDSDELLNLKKALDEVLREMHFEIETRPYHPHITIARSKEGTSTSLPSSSPMFKGRVVDQIHAVTLFKSDLSPEGARHTPLQIVPFGSL